MKLQILVQRRRRRASGPRVPFEIFSYVLLTEIPSAVNAGRDIPIDFKAVSNQR
jgi:hypothetical protein